MKLSASQRGHIHLAVIAIVVATFVGSVGLSVYSARQDDPSTAASLVELDETATSATSKLDKEAKKKAKQKAKLKKKGKGTVQITTKELVVNKQGKRLIKKRGNVFIRVTTTNPKAKCRDAGQTFKQQKGVVYQHKSDAKKGGNLGKLKIDHCSIGTYTLRPVLSSQYEVIESPGKFNVNAKKKTNLTVTIARKGQLASTAPVKGPKTPGGSGTKTPTTPPQFDPTNPGPMPTGPAIAGEIERCIATLQQYEEGQDIADELLERCEEVVPCVQQPGMTAEDCAEVTDPGLPPEDAQYE